MADTDTLTIAGRTFTSRLFVGTGKFPSMNEMSAAINASGTQLVTVAVRRMELDSPADDDHLSHLDTEQVLIVPNTSGARTADEALRIARISRAGIDTAWIKLELTPEPRHLLPDPVETLRAAELMVKEGFIVMPYINADPILARRLEDAGCATVMPLGSPIGTNRGIETREMIAIIIEQSRVPVVVDAGIGLPSHAAQAMEMGADAVLVNTAIATAANPVEIGRAFRFAIEAGRLGYLHSGVTVSRTARASSPESGFVRDLKR